MALSGIDRILQGEGVERHSMTPESLTYKSALQVLQASEDGGRGNYQGTPLLGPLFDEVSFIGWENVCFNRKHYFVFLLVQVRPRFVGQLSNIGKVH